MFVATRLCFCEICSFFIIIFWEPYLSWIVFCFLFSLAKDPIIQTTLRVYGVAAVPDKNNPELGRLVIITEAGIMNGLQLVQQEALPPHVLYRFFGDVAAAIHTLHAKNIIHHDIKPENILITSVSNILVSRYLVSNISIKKIVF